MRDAAKKSVVVSSGRVGSGLYFDGASSVTVNGTASLAPSSALTVSMWIRPLQLGSTGYLLAKSGSLAFPKMNADGSVDAQIVLSTYTTTFHVAGAVSYNIWSYLALTYDGVSMNVYLNGSLLASQAASGTIHSSSQLVALGSGFNGYVDDLNIYPWALAAGDVAQRYSLIPLLPPSQPLLPATTGPLVVGLPNTSYTFQFLAWDLNGKQINYQIDWGTGAVVYPQTAYLASGTTDQVSMS